MQNLYQSEVDAVMHHFAATPKTETIGDNRTYDEIAEDFTDSMFNFNNL